MDNQQEKIYAMALTRLSGLSLVSLHELYEQMGSATAIAEHRNAITDVLPNAQPRLIQALSQFDEPLQRAEAEMEYCLRYGIKVLDINDIDYPQRLKECADAPLVLFYRGTADLNQRHIINIIGTRHCTTYGQDLIRRFCNDLRQCCPDVLIVSGLAYGIDICAHRQALANGFETVGVLAHGHDDLYPGRHRDTATQMLNKGGLLTEYMTQTQPLPQNFVQRNRIVAGMSDACILVESARKGGGLITANIAKSYDREVFAFPGAVGAPYSEGCNHLIANNGALLITSAEDFVKEMGWQTDAELEAARAHGIERSLFPNLSDDEQRIVNVLTEHNDMQVNMLAMQTAFSVGQLSALLFELEMKGVVRTLAGGTYHLNSL